MSDLPPINQHDCAICLDYLLSCDLIHLSCDHYLCKSCTQRGWPLALKNESFFPFQCCVIPIHCATVAKFISSTDRIAYNNKWIEYSTVGQRTYCSYPTCSAFIPEILIEGRIALCPDCQKWTCRKCQAPEHQVPRVPHGNCPGRVEGIEALQAVAKKEGWQTCPNCGDLRELREGCFHIKCTCRMEFCYLCKSIWKSCSCPVWSERFIISARPLPVVRAPPPIPIPAPAPVGVPAQLPIRAPVPAPILPRVPAPPPLPVPLPAPAPARVIVLAGRQFRAPTLPEVLARIPGFAPPAHIPFRARVPPQVPARVPAPRPFLVPVPAPAPVPVLAGRQLQAPIPPQVPARVPAPAPVRVLAGRYLQAPIPLEVPPRVPGPAPPAHVPIRALPRDEINEAAIQQLINDTLALDPPNIVILHRVLRLRHELRYEEIQLQRLRRDVDLLRDFLARRAERG